MRRPSEPSTNASARPAAKGLDRLVAAWPGCCCWSPWPGRFSPAASTPATTSAPTTCRVRAFFAEQLARGEPFDWMPQLYSGFYLTGEGQGGTYHPWHLLLYRCLPLRGRLGVGMARHLSLSVAGHVAVPPPPARPRRRRHAGEPAVHLLQLQPAALRPSQRRGGHRPHSLAAVGDRYRAHRFAAAQGGLAPRPPSRC